MNTKEISEIKKKLKFTKRQREILVGLLLGDGHLETQNNGRTFRLKVEHGMTQSDYLHWLFQEFREWIPAKKPYKKKRVSGQESCGFTTYSHPAFRFYGQQFYSTSGIKRIPQMLSKMLSKLSLAVWFMDDGSRKSTKHRTYNIHTLGYTKQDLRVTQKALHSVFGLETTLHAQKKSNWRLYILSKSATKFTTLIREDVWKIPSMRKKLIT